MQPLPALIAALALAACVSACVPGAPAGRGAAGADDYAAYCAACHGPGGRGDEPGAEGLSRRPADLTRLSAANRGTFPATRVMAKIYGYTGGRGSDVMPAFGPLLEGDLMPYDGGDGIATPTPARLVALAEYLRALQP